MASNMTNTTAYSVLVTNVATGCTKTSDPDTIIVTGCNTMLNLTAYVEGFMDGSVMKPVLQNSGVSGATASQCDTFTVELRNTTSPYALVYDTFAVVGTNGQGMFTFPGTVAGNSYYIVVKHRNALETWSANPVAFTSNTSYSFGSGQSQAYGNNMVEVGGVWCMYSGDIDAVIPDGNINGTDYSVWELDDSNFETGYKQSDINGDGNVSGPDYSIWELNDSLFISVQKPN
jgi:hypothetical protein